MAMFERNPLTVGRAALALARIVRDPNRLDEVFALADAMRSPEVMNPIIERVKQEPHGVEALATLRRLARVDLRRLRALPEGTLGRAFAAHLDDNGLDPSALPEYEANDVLSYVAAHLTETHDVWHALTGFGSDVPGELGLQAFYLAQFPSRLAGALLGIGFLRYAAVGGMDHARLMNEVSRGWAMGKNARSLFGVDWDAQWEKPVAEVRRALGIELGGAPAAGERAAVASAMAQA